MYDKHSKAIQALINQYFEGIYTGDVAKLEAVFYPGTMLFGDIKGEPYLKKVAAYLDGVKNRKSPKELEEAFNMEILSIEILGSVATVKAHVPMLGFNYYDFLSLSLMDGKWKIVNKLFSHVE